MSAEDRITPEIAKICFTIDQTIQEKKIPIEKFSLTSVIESKSKVETVKSSVLDITSKQKEIYNKFLENGEIPAKIGDLEDLMKAFAHLKPPTDKLDKFQSSFVEKYKNQQLPLFMIENLTTMIPANGWNPHLRVKCLASLAKEYEQYEKFPQKKEGNKDFELFLKDKYDIKEPLKDQTTTWVKSIEAEFLNKDVEELIDVRNEIESLDGTYLGYGIAALMGLGLVSYGIFTPQGREKLLSTQNKIVDSETQTLLDMLKSKEALKNLDLVNNLTVDVWESSKKGTDQNKMTMLDNLALENLHLQSIINKSPGAIELLQKLGNKDKEKSL